MFFFSGHIAVPFVEMGEGRWNTRPKPKKEEIMLLRSKFPSKVPVGI